MLPDLYHAHHSRYMEDLPFWLELAGQAAGPVLELGCGTGRILNPLAHAGYPMVGLDNDLSILRFLRANLDENIGVPPLLIAADLCRFNLATQFSLIILPCNTFSTLEESARRSALNCIHKHLKPGGVFVVSLPNPLRLKAVNSRSDPQLEDEFYHPLTHNPVQVSSTWQRTKHTFRVTWIYDHLLPDGTVQRLYNQTIQQVVPLENYIAEIQNAGLQSSALYGDFSRTAYTPESNDLIILSQRHLY